MKNSCRTMGDFGASTRPISFAPKVKANKEKLLKSFREKLGKKGYLPAEAASMAAKVRAEANALAMEMNARQGNDDPVRMANIHTMALKLKISDALKAAPNKIKQKPEQRISRTSPMAVSAAPVKTPVPSNTRTMVTALADKGKSLSTVNVRKRGDMRRRPKEAQIYDMKNYRKARGKLKDDILNEAKRASYMQQFNGGLGHYYGGTMGFKFKKPAFVAKVQKAAAKVAAPVQKVAAVVAQKTVQAAKVVAKPVVQAAKFTAEKTVQAAKFVGEKAKQLLNFMKEAIAKILNNVKEFIVKLLKPIKDFFKKAWDKLRSVIVDKVGARFSGKGTAGFGSLPQDEQKKIVELTEGFVTKKIASAAATEAGIYGTAALATEKTAMIAAEKAAIAAGTASSATGPGAVLVAASAGTAAGTAAATGVAAAVTATAGSATTAHVTSLTTEGVQEVSTEFAKYKASKAIPNPIVRSVVNAGIDGKIPTNPTAIKQIASTLPAQAQAKFVEAVNKAPEAAKQEIIKKAIVPQDFKKTVDFLPKEAKVLADKTPAVPQAAAINMMQKSFEKAPGIVAPTPAQAKAITAESIAVQDKTAMKAVQEGKLTLAQGIAASSNFGKENAIKELPPEQRAAAVAAVKKEMSNVEIARIDEKAKEEKAKTNTALLTAAAIAAKVLLF